MTQVTDCSSFGALAGHVYEVTELNALGFEGAPGGVVGGGHGGWGGAFAGAPANTIDAMTSLGAAPRRIHAYVSPCISAEAFEVGEEVAEQFADHVVIRNSAWPRPHVDLKAELLQQLRTAGVAEANIQVDAACTASDTKRFYSYRAEGGTAGRMIGFIGQY